MKILLINPYWEESTYLVPSLGLAYITSMLLLDKHTVKIVDCTAERIKTDKLKEIVEEFSPDIVGITSMTAMIYEAIKTAKAVKSVSNAKVIMGGVHPSLLPEEVLKVKEIDFVVRGEAEITIRELVKAIENKGDYSKIKGVSFKRDNKIIHNPDRELIENLDDLPFPARSYFPKVKYKQHLGEPESFMTMMTSRGCPWKCIYCINSVNALFGRKYRTMSPERVVKEIELILKKYKVKEIDFYDDDFTCKRERVIEICDLITKKKFKFKWKCSSRVTSVDEQMLKKMKEAGCYLIAYGVETGSEELLRVIMKGQTKDMVRKTFELTKKAGIKTLAYFMIGIPGETKKTINETLRFAIELDPDYVQFAVVTPLPKTKLYEMVKSKNHLVGKSWKDFCFTGDHAKAVLRTDEFTSEELDLELKRMIKKFYLRPRYITKKILELYKLSNIKRNISGLKSVLKWTR